MECQIKWKSSRNIWDLIDALNSFVVFVDDFEH